MSRTKLDISKTLDKNQTVTSSLLKHFPIFFYYFEIRFVAKIYGTWKSTDPEYVDELHWCEHQRKHWNYVGFMFPAPPYIYYNAK